MRLSRADETRPFTNRVLRDELLSIESEFLRQTVEAIALPRHFVEEPDQNRKTRDFISSQLSESGYKVTFQSPCDNVIAESGCDPALPKLLIGAHYDSVPGSPGADDNASAVAALIAVARSIAQIDPQLPVLFVAFNREEESLLGSRQFAEHLKSHRPFVVREAHILEMIGYTDGSSHNQRKPFLPIRLPERSDFLGLIAKSKSNRIVEPLLRTAHTYVPEMSVLGLKIWLGADRIFKVLRRSDHSPLWDIGIPAIMWTDTSEFRNPHYHQPSDTPDTLDYYFLTGVAKLLLAHVLLTLKRWP